ICDLRFMLYNAVTNGAGQGGPLTNAATGVSNGLFTVTLDFGASAFSGADRWLEIAVRTNSGGAFSLLSPRQQVLPTPYAILAGNLAGGAITASQLAPRAAAANLQASGLSAVASGGFVLSEQDNATNLLNAGFVAAAALNADLTLDLWTRANTNGQPAGRIAYAAVWTGTQMLMWGGNSGGIRRDGGRFN